jgi:hypothetical protein
MSVIVFEKGETVLITEETLTNYIEEAFKGHKASRTDERFKKFILNKTIENFDNYEERYPTQSEVFNFINSLIFYHKGHPNASGEFKSVE